MGNTYEVWAWVLRDRNPFGAADDHKYALKYEGEDFDEAIEKMKALKKAEVRCVKFYWR